MELVLPGAYYYIQMQDGRMEVQGTVQQLRQQGILEDLEVNLISTEPTLWSLHEEDEDLTLEDKLDNADHKSAELEAPGPDRAWIEAQQARDPHRKKPRKLIEEEARQIGGVQWTIYETYLRAS